MDFIEKMVENLEIEDLQEKKLCIRCVAAGCFELYHPNEMQEGISTSDQICAHCYENEEESGYKKMTKKEMKIVGEIIKEFEKYKEKRLNIGHN